jgi:hypothetical protein
MSVTPTLKQTQRVQAVLALLHGVLVREVAEYSHLCRSDLYKFRRLALAAMEQAAMVAVTVAVDAMASKRQWQRTLSDEIPRPRSKPFPIRVLFDSFCSICMRNKETKTMIAEIRC